MTPIDAVTYASLLAGAICFVLYVWQTVATLLPKPVRRQRRISHRMMKAAVAVPGLSVDEITKLIEALGNLTEDLTKAGPVLTSLIGAILFFLIASVAAGPLHGAPPAAAPGAKDASAPVVAKTPKSVATT